MLTDEETLQLSGWLQDRVCAMQIATVEIERAIAALQGGDRRGAFELIDQAERRLDLVLLDDREREVLARP